MAPLASLWFTCIADIDFFDCFLAYMPVCKCVPAVAEGGDTCAKSMVQVDAARGPLRALLQLLPAGLGNTKIY